MTLILGRPGSGKTHLISELVNDNNFYGGKFDRILYVTPGKILGVIHDYKHNTVPTLNL